MPDYKDQILPGSRVQVMSAPGGKAHSDPGDRFLYGLRAVLLALAALACLCLLHPEHVQAASKTKNLSVKVGQSVQLRLDGVEEPLKWKSGSKKKLTVTDTGMITALKKGTVTVSVRYKKVTYKFRIKIKKGAYDTSAPVRTVTMKLRKVSPKKSSKTDSSGGAGSSSGSKKEKEKLQTEGITVDGAGLRTTAAGSYAEGNIIMVGDSRFVGMKSAVGGSAAWIAEVGEGLDWLKNTAVGSLMKMKLKGKAVVFNLGVNDLTESSSYIDYLNDLAVLLRARGASAYFMTVNPIADKVAKSKGYKVRNESVIAFNKALASGLKNFGIIDTYDVLASQGFSTKDGIHYSTDTYKLIYSTMMSAIG